MSQKLSGKALQRLSAEEAQSAKRLPFAILLDNVRSGNNVGSVLRTADAFRVGEVILTGICAQPPHRDILKTSLGAEKTVPWVYHQNALNFIVEQQKRGVQVAVIEQTTNAIPLDEWWPKHNEAWVVILGNEVTGVSDALIQCADVCLEVPQFGAKHSLNVSVCAGMVAWEYMHKTGLQQLRIGN